MEGGCRAVGAPLVEPVCPPDLVGLLLGAKPSRLKVPPPPLTPAGQTQYLQAVREVYRQLQASWLTPVEILQPHYGRAIASCILRRWHEQVGPRGRVLLGAAVVLLLARRQVCRSVMRSACMLWPKATRQSLTE